MATPFDPTGLYPPFYDDAPDPSTLQWPWSQPPTPDPTIMPQAAVPPIAAPPELLAAPAAGVVPAPLPELLPPAQTLPSMQAPPDALSGGIDLSQPLGELAGAYTPTRAPDQLPAAQYHTAATKLAQGPFDPATGDIRADVSDEDAQRYFNELARRDPAGYAEQVARLADAKSKRILTEHAKIAERDFQQQQANNKMRLQAISDAQKKSDALVADAARLAATKEDPSGGVHGGRLVAGAIASFIGGFNKGGPNYGMQALDSAIANGIAAQRSDLANQRESLNIRRGALAEEYARHGDEYQAAETVRLAALKHADDLLATEQQNYAPRGTTFMKIANLRAQVAAAQQQSVEAHQQKTFENSLKLQDAARQQQIADETARHNRATTGLGYAQLKSADDDRKLQRQIHAADKAAEVADKESERDRQFTISSPRPTIALDDKGKPVIGPDGKPVTLPAQFTNKNGQRWRVGSPERTAAMTAKVVSASEIADMIDEVLDIRDKVGGESTLWNSDAAQRLKVLQSRLALVRKNGTQGMSSDKDFENLSASIGADDLTSFRARAAGLKEARERTVSELNSEMRAANYDGPAVSFANKYAGATNTAEDDRRKKLLIPPSSFDDALKANLDKATAARGYGIDVNDPADQELYQRISAETRATASGATQDQADSIATLGRRAASGDAASRATLDEIAKNAGSTRLRELAKAEIEAITPRPTPRGPATHAVTVPDELRLR